MKDKILTKHLEVNVNKCKLLAIGMELRIPKELNYEKFAQAVSVKYGYKLMEISPSKAIRVS
jgi:hypothetical protein